VDHATEDVTASDRAAVGSADRVGNWLGELQATMWSRLVVVTEVLVEHRLEMSSRDDEEEVEALLTRGPHPPRTTGDHSAQHETFVNQPVEVSVNRRASMRGPAKGLYAFRREDVAGRDWQRYSPSPAGVEAAREFAESQKPVSVQWMGSCRRFLTERSFTQLLRDVYAAYPEYATASQFSG
jgi:hypothetical protein